MTDGGTGNGKPVDAAEVARVMGRYQLAQKLVPAVYIVVAWVPLQAVVAIAQALAGRQTNFTSSITWSISVSVILGGTVITQWFKSRGQKDELKRLRLRIEGLEAELKKAQGE